MGLLALQDAKRWDGKNIEQGFKQVVFEFIPIRSDQLLGLYGPGGARRLLPEAQPNATSRVAAVKLDTAAGNASQAYLQVGNGHDFAVDVSGWRVADAAGSGFSFTFPPGGWPCRGCWRWRPAGCAART